MNARTDTRPGVVTWAGLAVVAAAAAVLSFATVRDLAQACGYPPRLAWLLPVVIDATAVVGSRIWLGGGGGAPAALRYARTLALAAAVVTIGANVLQHGLAAYRLAPPWWLVAALAAIPPTALVAVAHQVALLARPGDAAAAVVAPVVEVPVVEVPVRMVADKPEHLVDEKVDKLGEVDEAPGAELAVVSGDAGAYEAQLRVRARRLMAESPVPVGRRRLAELLEVSDWQARQLLAELTPDTDSDVQSGTDTDSDLTYARS